ncbi:MAG TPA: DNA polymerase III subunit beta [bacterium]|nr:DNA polymerase III subunit beta [bacterium]
MELKIKKTDFLNLLKWSQGIVEKRGTMPILSNILLETGDKSSNTLKVSATDLEIALVAEGGAEIKAPGRVVVNARNLYEIVKEAPEEIIHLSKKGDFGIEIASGKSRFRVVGMNPAEFPTLPQVASKEEVPFESDELEEMIGKTFYAASTDETRYTLNGLYLVRVAKGDKGYLRVVATDGHRLAYADRETSAKLNLPKGIIIPRKGVSEIKNLIGTGEGNLSVSIDERAIVFHKGKVSLTIRLIEGEFPNYEQVIPKKSEKIVSVDRALLMGALRRASIMTSDQARGVRFNFGTGVVEVSASHPDLGEASEEIPIDYKGATFQVGFNPRYFLDVLSVLEDEKLILELKDEISPCVIRSEFDRGFLALVMPMRI